MILSKSDSFSCSINRQMTTSSAGKRLMSGCAKYVGSVMEGCKRTEGNFAAYCLSFACVSCSRAKELLRPSEKNKSMRVYLDIVCVRGECEMSLCTWKGGSMRRRCSRIAGTLGSSILSANAKSNFKLGEEMHEKKCMRRNACPLYPSYTVSNDKPPRKTIAERKVPTPLITSGTAGSRIMPMRPRVERGCTGTGNSSRMNSMRT